ncbi:MFS transporter [Aureimonas jatrophae]|uniref:Predicted arabinose efflux permease, MFS family n=1 Tax=Aureimonas jatrophae TaxID=1166073 RepID=A0A1H0C9C2_9HYPH|nr:MFS transporter [Aureimonas jatrophae]MBB3949127.1 MFS family permease [Aureimonas jatrophae]SDN54478.1 Predicted arabinose efflux permease, MFS family [Aureimonas jatrophae]
MNSRAIEDERVAAQAAARGKPLALAFREPSVRAAMIAIFFFGFSGAATAPYQSVVGIRELGLANGVYAALILLSAAVNVVVSVAVGMLADRLGRTRSLMIATSAFGVVGAALIYLVPSQASFVVSGLVFSPVYGAVNGLLFATVRVATDRLDGDAAGAVNSTVRAALSLSWVLVPGLTALALTGRASMLPAYLISALAALVLLLVIVVMLPREARGAAREIGAAVPDRSALSSILSAGVALRMIALALVCSALHVNGAVLPLIVTGAAEGTVADIGIVVGIVAALEVVFIFVWTRIQRRINSVRALVAGTVLYAIYLALLGLSTAPWHVYALTLLSGFAAAALISIPITYLQDLMRGRPGLGSSLISVNFFMSGGICAAIFAFGTHVTTYGGTSVIGGAAALLGGAMLFALDGRRGAPDV